MTFKEDAEGRPLDRLAPGNWQRGEDQLVWVNMATAYRVDVVDVGGWRLQVFTPGNPKGVLLASPLAAGTTLRDREDVVRAWLAWQRDMEGHVDIVSVEELAEEQADEGVMAQQVRLGLV